MRSHTISLSFHEQQKACKANPPSKMNRQAYACLLACLNAELYQDVNHSLPRSCASSMDSTLSTILRLLAQETARPDVAERELSRDAWLEINRAQTVVAEVDRARVDAEERSR